MFLIKRKKNEQSNITKTNIMKTNNNITIKSRKN